LLFVSRFVLPIRRFICIWHWRI